MTMIEHLLLLQFGWRDGVDILVIAIVIYSVLSLIRRTRALPMAIGLVALAAAYFTAQAVGLLTVEALAAQIFFYLPFAVVVLFQHEIRRALASLGQNRMFAFLSPNSFSTRIDEIVTASVDLSNLRFGALIAVERVEDLRLYTESGKELEALLSRELLINIFTPNTPLHDGAVIVRRDRIVAAACFLPLTSRDDLPSVYGTRHRAALGLSEETDAVVIVISEENGSIAVASEGRLHENLSATDFRTLLDRVLVSSTAGREGA